MQRKRRRRRRKWSDTALGEARREIEVLIGRARGGDRQV